MPLFALNFSSSSSEGVCTEIGKTALLSLELQREKDSHKGSFLTDHRLWKPSLQQCFISHTLMHRGSRLTACRPFPSSSGIELEEGRGGMKSQFQMLIAG